uniref:26S proteasome non-ATPase regulatory subunit 2 homolog n=1 Tax=Chlamydomonas leiostraca TaxID=1034604 RepID=A0A7S0WJK1_9CHLO|mmetsp:Transcript_15417/g.38391  ORF Transcript_15417/g.38391 Transcript_15417/m.38391 type:complete len:899 (+) Transcript_15417:202-2898(+)|eukprot:CAMPEP_0202865610 /NCGR_PEP_ID=MMETSP1391-20130828/6256_1 /ASSEMBLY_ACC=CAM_ASM_000867 /TAXON_ID=1034604 /ORGANISM="Chlamydomonas leiostraca, Strain SAG 11-49" /LENGTH=898 /DNA_ID=CAMNT_0049545471 /DNA_START=199 /DNA_END=2895 /DNA_ORIENTATION=-
MAVTEDKPKDTQPQKDAKDAKDKKKGKDEDKEPELSEEDLALKTNLELMVERVNESDPGVQVAALNAMIHEIRTATATMTSVPKPLKFLSPHADGLKARCEALPVGSQSRALLADVVSVLSTTVAAKEGVRDALKFRLQGSKESLGVWGHEYMRHLAGEIAEEWRLRREGEGAPTDDLMTLVTEIVPYHMAHNAEPEAVDLLLEVERLDLLPQYVDDTNYSRTCMYLVSCCHYLPEPDDSVVLETAHAIYTQMKKSHDAMRVALHLNKRELVEATWAGCGDALEKKQLAYLLARHGYRLNLEEGPAAVEDEGEREALREALSNSRLSEHFLALARDLDVMEAKTPEDVYKTHLADGRQPTGAAVDSARANLASSFVNAFVNAGFGQDKLVTVATEGSDQVHWIFKNKDHGKTSATASLGMITLWDVEGGLPQIDKYLYSTDNYVVAGALLAIGIVNCGVQNENDPAYALIYDYVANPDVQVRTGAILGLGLAYAGSQRDEISELLVPLVGDPDVPLEVAGCAALALGLVFTSSCREEIVMAVLQALMCRSEVELATPAAKQLCLGLGLLFLGKQDQAEATGEVVKTLSDRVSRFAALCLEGCAYAGTGNVLKVQEFLAVAGEHIEGAAEEGAGWKAAHQGAAVLGLALVAMAEPLGVTMAGRALEHALQYGEPAVKRAVPLALALLNISNPEILVLDTLSRLSHDLDGEVAGAAILSLGLVGAGTNNARLAGMLRNLASYYYKDPSQLFMVRIAQGLVHMGKGLLGLNPYHTDRQLLSGMALSGLLAVLVAGLDIKATIGGKQHHLLYCLATAMAPRMLMTLDEEGKLLAVPCRVGQAVDVVAQAGRPKTITGFQTHNTPVLMNAGERAELGTEKYKPLSPILEGIVLCRKNPDYVEE